MNLILESTLKTLIMYTKFFKTFFLLFFFIPKTIFAQRDKELVHQFSEELCEELSKITDTVQNYTNFYTAIDRVDAKILNKIIQRPEFKELVLLIEPKLKASNNPYNEACKQILLDNQTRCTSFTKFWKLNKPVKQSIISIGDSTCHCIELSVKNKNYATINDYLSNFQDCALKAIQYPVYGFQARNDFNLSLKPEEFDTQLKAYFFTQCPILNKSSSESRLYAQWSIQRTFGDLWLAPSSSIHSSLKSNNLLSDTLIPYFENTKDFKYAQKQVQLAKNIFPKDFGHTELYEKDKGDFLHSFIYIDWHKKAVLGKLIVTYYKNSLGKIKNISFLPPDKIPNIKKLTEDIAKIPPPPPPPPPPPAPTNKN